MIPLFKVRMQESAIEEAVKVLKSNYIGEGEKVKEFEEALKEYFNWPYVITTNSATSAEHLALHMLKEKYSGCEVLCTPLSCTATNWPVVLNNYKIKWVDVDPNTLNMDMDDLARKITPSTCIVYIVHWSGYPIDYLELDNVLEKCEETYGFRPVVIEDCAHAMGSKWGRFRLGATHMTSYATYSFQAIKHVTSIDGGCLLCPDENSYKRAKLLRWYGIDRENNKKDFRCEADIKEVGFKFHQNNVNAAIGIENLKGLDDTLEKTRKCAKYYDENITSPLVRKIPYNPDCSYWLYTMFVEKQKEFMEHMKKHGIAVSRVHERNDIHSCVKEFKAILPNLDKVVKEMICIPVGFWVTKKDLEYIVQTIDKGW